VSLSAGTGRKLVVLATNSDDSTGTIDSAAFDGNAMTSFYNRTLSSLTRERWFYYDIPNGVGAAAYNIDVVLSADSLFLVVGAWVTSGETAGAPQYVTDLTLTGSATVDVAISSPASGVVLFSSQRYGTTTATLSSSDVTILGATGNGGSNGRTEVGYAATASAQTATGLFTWGSTISDKRATAVVTTPAATSTIAAISSGYHTRNINR
jgi:hypothetical protein